MPNKDLREEIIMIYATTLNDALDELAEETRKGLMENIHNYIDYTKEFQNISNKTNKETFPLIALDEDASLIDRLIAKHLLSGGSVWDEYIRNSLESLIIKTTEDCGERIVIEFYCGSFYTIYKLYQTLGLKKKAETLKPWAWWSVYE